MRKKVNRIPDEAKSVMPGEKRKLCRPTKAVSALRMQPEEPVETSQPTVETRQPPATEKKTRARRRTKAEMAAARAEPEEELPSKKTRRN